MGITSDKGATVHHSSCRISVLWIHTVALCSYMPCVYIYSLFFFITGTFFTPCSAYCIDRKVYKCLNSLVWPGTTLFFETQMHKPPQRTSFLHVKMTSSFRNILTPLWCSKGPLKGHREPLSVFKSDSKVP